jgi:hypothetical protein
MGDIKVWGKRESRDASYILECANCRPCGKERSLME